MGPNGEAPGENRARTESLRLGHLVFAESSKFASESIGAFRTVASLTSEDAICDQFEKLCRGHVVTAFKKARWVSLLFAFGNGYSGMMVLIQRHDSYSGMTFKILRHALHFRAVVQGVQSAEGCKSVINRKAGPKTQESTIIHSLRHLLSRA